MDLRETFFGSKLRAAGTVFGGLFLLLGLLVLFGVFGVPTVQGVQNSFDDVNASTTVIQTNLTIHNPNPIGIGLSGASVDYTVRMNRIPVANGTKQGVAIGSGNSTLVFHTLMDNQRIPPWWRSHVRNDERSQVRVNATACDGLIGQCLKRQPVNRTIKTDLMGGFNSTKTRSVNANLPLVSDPIAYINRTGAHWGTVTQDRTPVRIAFRVYNPKSYPVTISNLGYIVSMNEIDVGEGELEDSTVIPPKSARTVRTTVGIRIDALDEWWVSHLRNDQVTQLRIDFYATISAESVSIRTQLPELTHTKTIRTDIFGNKNRTGPSDGEPPTTTTDGNGQTTTTDDDGLLNGDTTTDDGLLDGDTTTTSEETTTDDGGLLGVVFGLFAG